MDLETGKRKKRVEQIGHTKNFSVNVQKKKTKRRKA